MSLLGFCRHRPSPRPAFWATVRGNAFFSRIQLSCPLLWPPQSHPFPGGLTSPPRALSLCRCGSRFLKALPYLALTLGFEALVLFTLVSLLQSLKEVKKIAVKWTVTQTQSLGAVSVSPSQPRSSLCVRRVDGSLSCFSAAPSTAISHVPGCNGPICLPATVVASPPSPCLDGHWRHLPQYKSGLLFQTPRGPLSLALMENSLIDWQSFLNGLAKASIDVSQFWCTLEPSGDSSSDLQHSRMESWPNSPGACKCNPVGNLCCP